ncbi:MAG: hypothetical protein JSW59_16520 [Phycisphaerales bacterium]|nr:MAG: hypothetical protein JSW59_16520 [Phycisphaerales bacterium]
MKHLRLSNIMWAGVCLALLSGCAKKEDDSPAEPNTDTESTAQVPPERTEASPKEEDTVQPSADGAFVKDVLALWETGQKDDAARQFMAIQWDAPSTFREVEVLIMSEQQLRALPQSEMKRVVEEVSDLLGKLRKLMFQVVSVGEKLASSGDTDMAKEHFEAVRLYGEALLQPERLEIVRLHGKAAVAYAQKRLSGIKQ